MPTDAPHPHSRQRAAPRAPSVASSAPRRALSAQFSQHRENDATNSPDSTFDFTAENYLIVQTFLDKYPRNYKQSAIIPLLDLAQRQCGNFLPVAAMDKVAQVVGVPAVRVYEVASFYTMFNRERVGKYFIQLCACGPGGGARQRGGAAAARPHPAPHTPSAHPRRPRRRHDAVHGQRV